MALANVIAADVRVLNSTVLIAGQRGADFSYESDMADVTVTPAAGVKGFKEFLPTITTWSVSLKGVAMAGAATGFGTLLGYIKAGTVLTLKIEMNYVTSAATEYYAGSGYCKSAKLSGANLAGEATYDLEIQGTGALTITNS